MIFKENDIILKKLGRINNFYNKNINKPAATFVISGDLFKIYFDQTIDLNLIKPKKKFSIVFKSTKFSQHNIAKLEKLEKLCVMNT